MTLNPSHKYPPDLSYDVGDTILDHYRIEEIQGPLGSIWYARASYTFAPQLSYSIQILPKSEQVSNEFLEDFLNEKDRLSAVESPPFVALIRSEVLDNGDAILVHEYVPSHSIHDLSSVEPFTIVQMMRIVESLAGTLESNHQRGRAMQGLTHFDLMLDMESEWSPEPVVILHAPYAIGTACLDPVRVYGYMSWYHAPEYRRVAKTSVAADVYALGMLSSILMFPQRHRRFLGSPEAFDFGELESFRPCILMALAENPSDRQKSAADFIEMMRRARTQPTLSDRPIASLRHTRVFASRLPATTIDPSLGLLDD